jgi:hypothetical protein
MTACAILRHSALTATPAVLIHQAPGKEFAHTIVQVYGGPHGGGQIYKRYYGEEELFHVETYAKVLLIPISQNYALLILGYPF